jgi:hypothetical protein
MTNQTLKDFFDHLTDEDLIARVRNGLTLEAHAMACDELKRRGLEPPMVEAPQESEDEPYLGDMLLLARNLKPTEAHILASCLASAGIHAVPCDVNTVQTNSLWSLAIGGAKVRVAQSQLLEAQQILNAIRRGELTLDDDFDVGEAGE